MEQSGPQSTQCVHDASHLDHSVRDLIEARVIESCRRERRVAYAVLLALTLVTGGTIFTLFSHVVDRVAAKATDQAAKEATSLLAGHAKVLEESYVAAAAGMRDELRLFTDRFASAMEELGKARNQMTELQADLARGQQEISQIQAEAQRTKDAIGLAAEQVQADYEAARSNTDALLSQIRAKEQDLSDLGLRLRELQTLTSHLDEAVLRQGMSRLAAFQQLLADQQGEAVLVKLKAQLTAMEQCIDTERRAIDCREITVRNSAGNVVCCVSPSAGEATAPSRSGLLTLCAGDGSARVTIAAYGEGSAVTLANSRGSPVAVLGVNREQSGLIRLTDANGSLRLAAWGTAAGGILSTYADQETPLTKLFAEGKSGMVETFSGGVRVNSLGVGRDGHAGLWVYRSGYERHVATVQDNQDGPVMSVENPENGTRKSVSSQ